MSFILMIFLCMSNSSYAMEKLLTSDQPPQSYEEIVIDHLDQLSLSSQGKLTSSLATRTPKTRCIQCHHCNTEIKGGPSQLKRHIVRAHLVCCYCSPRIKFPNKNSIDDHLIECHPDYATWLRNVICNHCSQKFKTGSDLKKHRSRIANAQAAQLPMPTASRSSSCTTP